MPAPQPPPEPTSAAETEDARYRRGLLHGLIDAGMKLAELVHQKTKAGEISAEDAVVAFDSISRAVCRLVGLAQQVDKPPVDKLLAQRARTPAQQRAAAHQRVLRELDDLESEEDSEAESLHAESLDRLDVLDGLGELDDDLDLDLDEGLGVDIASLSMAEIVADICRGLSLATLPEAHPWVLHMPEDVAALCAQVTQLSAAFAQPEPPPGRSGNDPPLHPDVPRAGNGQLAALRWAAPPRAGP